MAETTHWIKAGWLEAAALRRLRHRCDREIGVWAKKHADAKEQAKRDNAATPAKPAELTQLESQKGTIESLLSAQSQPRAEATKLRNHIISLLIALALIVVTVVVWNFAGRNTSGPVALPETSNQILLISFAIALATYFATVVRSIVDRMRFASDADKATLRLDIRYIRAGEHIVVFLAVLTLYRIVAPVYPAIVSWWPWLEARTAAEADGVLLLLFAVIVVYAAVLHVREWYFRK